MVSFEPSHSNLLHFNMKVDSCIQRCIPAPIAAVDWMDPAPSELIPSFMSSRLIVRLISIPHISTERTTCSLYLLLLELQCASWDTSPLLLFGGLYLYIFFRPWMTSLAFISKATAFSTNSSCLCSFYPEILIARHTQCTLMARPRPTGRGVVNAFSNRSAHGDVSSALTAKTQKWSNDGTTPPQPVFTVC